MIGTVALCGHCGRPIIAGVGMSVAGGDGRLYHYECARSPYATAQSPVDFVYHVDDVAKSIKEKNT